MKKTLLPGLLLLSVVACNNTASTDKSGAAAAAATAAKEQTPDASAPSCASFLWFKKGTVLEYEMKDGTGKKLANTITTINDVRQEGDALIAEYTTSYGKEKQMQASYKCEAGKLYVNMKSIFDNLGSALKRPGMEMEVTDSYLSFPWDMKPGDALEGSSFEIKTKQDGKDFMIMKSVVKDRKVEALEKVTTAGGSWECLRLSETRVTTMSMMGKEVSSRAGKSTQWFAPGAGMVKYESYDDAGKMQHSSELISIK